MLHAAKIEPQIFDSLAALRDVGTVDRFKTDTAEIAFWVAGAPLDDAVGTIVFIHGNSACKEAFCHQLADPDLARFAMVAIDLPGHGESSDARMPVQSYTIPSYAKDVAKLLDHLGINKPILVGWSLGGHVAIEMAANGVEIAGILSVSAPPVKPGAKNLKKAFLSSYVGDVTTAEDPGDVAISAYIMAMYGSMEAIPGAFYQAAFRTDGRARRYMGEHWASGASGHDQQEFVKRWDRPIAVLNGWDDPFVCPYYLLDLTWKNLWQRRLQYWDGVGHAPFLEFPKRFNALLQEFAEDVLAL